jgi:hypothetical protein
MDQQVSSSFRMKLRPNRSARGWALMIKSRPQAALIQHVFRDVHGSSSIEITMEFSVVGILGRRGRAIGSNHPVGVRVMRAISSRSSPSLKRPYSTQQGGPRVEPYIVAGPVGRLSGLSPQCARCALKEHIRGGLRSRPLRTAVLPVPDPPRRWVAGIGVATTRQSTRRATSSNASSQG